MTTTLLYLYGIATVVAGLALVWWRDESIAQLPVLIARVDDALPFADDWEDWQYVAAGGVVLVLVGVLVMVCAGYLSLGSRVAYVIALVVSAALVAFAVYTLQHVSEDLITWATDVLLATSAIALLSLLLLLVSPRSRRFIGSR